MFKKIVLVFALGCTLAAPLLLADSYSPKQHVVVRNRILAKVNGKTISVIDLMKQMDAFLLRHHPDHLASPELHYQFLATQWRPFLNQMINNELILADADDKEIAMEEAEIRKELHERFGPNVMENLDLLGLTHEEAHEMVRKDLVLQSMNWHRVHAKVLQNVGPHKVKQAYQEYCVQHPPQQEWDYEVLSISGVSEETATQLGERANHLLAQGLSSLKDVATVLQNEAASELENSDVRFAVSELVATDKTISPMLKSALLALHPGSHTPMLAQKSRSDQQLIHRIYRLKDHREETLPAFEAMAEQIRLQLLDQEAEREATRYAAWLRNKFAGQQPVEENIPPDFEPFASTS